MTLEELDILNRLIAAQKKQGNMEELGMKLAKQESWAIVQEEDIPLI